MGAGYIDNIDSVITLYMRKNSLTQRQMAEKLGMSEPTLCSRRNGTKDYRLSELMKLSELTGLSLDELTSTTAA